mgnify:FL=1
MAVGYLRFLGVLFFINLEYLMTGMVFAFVSSNKNAIWSILIKERGDKLLCLIKCLSPPFLIFSYHSIA